MFALIANIAKAHTHLLISHISLFSLCLQASVDSRCVCICVCVTLTEPELNVVVQIMCLTSHV